MLIGLECDTVPCSRERNGEKGIKIVGKQVRKRSSGVTTYHAILIET